MSEGSIAIRSRGQTAVHGSQGISWTQWRTGEHGLLRCGENLLDRVLPGLDLRTSAVSYQSAEISPTRKPRASRDLEAPDLARKDGRRGFGDLFGVAGGENRKAEFLGLFEELVDGIEADGDEDGVAGERPFRSGDRAEAVIDAGDGHRFDRIGPLALTMVCECKDGDAEPGELVPVDLVPAALRHGFDEPDDGDAGLKGVIAGDEADVPPADDEQASSRADEVAVDQRLKGPGPVNAGKGVAREGQVLFAGPGSRQEDIGRRPGRIPGLP